jgi:hypothetical protein
VPPLVSFLILEFLGAKSKSVDILTKFERCSGRRELKTWLRMVVGKGNNK